MKESKTYKSTAKGKSINKSSSNPRPLSNDNVKIRQVSPQEKVDKDFEGVEEDNKRLVVFIAIGILVIVGTIIGLLIGLKNKKEEEPKKPEDEIVIPTVPEEDKKEEEYYGREKPLPVVRKVTKKSSSKSTSSDSGSKEESEKHSITYYNGENSEKVEIEEGTKLVDHKFPGYKDCSFYYDEEHEEEVESDATAVEDMNVYAVCTLINYTIDYDTESTNITTYNVEMADYTLEAPNASNELNFGGWYLESTFETRVTKLTKSIVDYADSDNVIKLYAKFSEAIQIDYYDGDGNLKNSEEHNPTELYTLLSGEGYCSVGEFDGWATSKDAEAEYEAGAEINVEVPMQYYAVCKNVSSLSLGANMQTMTLIGEAADLTDDKELLLDSEDEEDKLLKELDLDEESKEEKEELDSKEEDNENKEELDEEKQEELNKEVLTEENKEDESNKELTTNEEEEENKEELTEENEKEEKEEEEKKEEDSNKVTDNNPEEESEEENKEVVTSKAEEEVKVEDPVNEKKEEVVKTEIIKEEKKEEVSVKKEEEKPISKKEEKIVEEEEETETEDLIQE